MTPISWFLEEAPPPYLCLIYLQVNSGMLPVTTMGDDSLHAPVLDPTPLPLPSGLLA